MEHILMKNRADDFSKVVYEYRKAREGKKS